MNLKLSRPWEPSGQGPFHCLLNRVHGVDSRSETEMFLLVLGLVPQVKINCKAVQGFWD